MADVDGVMALLLFFFFGGGAFLPQQHIEKNMKSRKRMPTPYRYK